MVRHRGPVPFAYFIVATSLILNFSDVDGKSRVPDGLPKGQVTYDVKLFTEKQYEGKMLRLKVEVDSCMNLPSTWENQIASIDASSCLILYAEKHCRGFRKRLDKWSFGSTNLKDIAFDNKLMSVSSCPTLKKPVIPDDDEL